MNAIRGYYCLIQFCPDPSRAEGVNVGVLLFCPDAKFIAARTAAGNRRAAKLVGRKGLDTASLNSAKRAIERRLHVDRDAFQSLEDLQHFVDTRANILKLTNPRPVKVSEPPADLINRLFEDLVGGRPRQRSPREVIPELDALFQRLHHEGRARLDWTVNVPVLGRGLRIPYAYRNGVWNLIKPQTFANQEASALSMAMRLAVEGDLLQRHGEDEQGRKHLVVVSTFEAGENVGDLQNRVTDVLREYRVETVLEHHVADFVAKVAQEAR